jgi:epoxyqueuosine reductase
VGFADASAPWDATAQLAEFLALGYHGDMGWMAAHADRRGHPTDLWADARTAIVVGLSYRPDFDPAATLSDPLAANISVYARGDDYHELIKKRLKALGAQVAKVTAAEIKVFVDTAPLMEKPLAQRAGLGWQGKHTNLVSRQLGSWFFLGVVLVAAEIPADPAEVDHCGTCRACLDACPTQAFPAPRQLDARRCISYLTIEFKGIIPRAFRVPMGNRIYGCDDCLLACPWNKFARRPGDPAFAPRGATDLAHLLDLDDAGFRARFAKSPIKRIGRDRFLRNVLIAAGNAGEPGLMPQVARHLGDPAAIVRAMAVWAFSRLTDAQTFDHARIIHLPQENDPSVVAEWTASAG